MEENNLVTCHNRLCGRTVSSKFEKCPFCGTPLPLSKLSIDEVLSDFSKQEKDERQSHREKVLKYFRIEGDVSDEQFEELNKKYHQINDKGDTPLLTLDAEPILNKYSGAVKYVGIVLMIVFFIIAIGDFVLMAEYEETDFLFDAISSIIKGVIVYSVCIVMKAFIDVFVNISITLQDINAKIDKSR